jgi:hypothetical protein
VLASFRISNRTIVPTKSENTITDGETRTILRMVNGVQGQQVGLISFVMTNRATPLTDHLGRQIAEFAGDTFSPNRHRPRRWPKSLPGLIPQRDGISE